MRKICSFGGCKQIVEARSGQVPRCPKHPLSALRQPKKNYGHHQLINGSNLYYSNRWKKIRSQVLSHKPLCVMCESMRMLCLIQITYSHYAASAMLVRLESKSKLVTKDY